MKLYLIAGEDSGDLHAKNLIVAMRERQPDLEVRGVGGDQMQRQGVKLMAHIRDINFMGFLEVLRNLRTIRKLFKTVKEDIKSWRPDAVILIDYPGFNLRMAKFLNRQGIRTFYYISPQVWAWKKGRVKTIRRYTERMYVILPFEKAFFAKEGLEVDFVGHPLLDAIGEVGEEKVEPPVIALLPGSRKQEIRKMLPVMLQMVDRFPDYQFTIAGAPSMLPDFYREIIGDMPVKLVMNKTYDVLRQASYALVTSGTATLETGLFRVPQVVCYRGNPLSFFIGKRLVNVKFISLVNLILGREAVRELIQTEFTVENLARELKNLFVDETRIRIQQDYQELWEKLGNSGASKRTAEYMLSRIKSPWISGE